MNKKRNAVFYHCFSKSCLTIQWVGFIEKGSFPQRNSLIPLSLLISAFCFISGTDSQVYFCPDDDNKYSTVTNGCLVMLEKWKSRVIIFSISIDSGR